MDSLKRGRLLVIGAALCWSTAGAVVKTAQTAFSGWQIATLRSLFAFLFLAVLVRPWRARRIFPGLKVLLLALAYAGVMFAYVTAITLTTAANAIFLQDTAPLWVLLLAPWMLKEPFRPRDLWFLLCCGVGLSLFFFDELSPGQLTGNLLALVSGVCYAVTILGLRWGSGGARGETGLQPVNGGEVQAPNLTAGKLPAPPSRDPLPLKFRSPANSPAPADSADPADPPPTDAELIVVWGNLLCVPIGLPFFGFFGGWPALPEALVPLLLVAFLGVVQLGLGYYLIARGIRHVPAVEASLLVLLEPVLNPIWTYFVRGEVPGPWALLGGAVILATVASQALRGRAGA